jgi:restriction endonuclease
VDRAVRSGLMKQWEEYQHQAAGLLRELGFNAEVDAQLAEANGAVHAIDVAASRTVAGVDLLWIVECKYWNKPVDMGTVRDLRTLVLDLGADRGLLMSESGFQSGALMAAKGKSITLTSLADLRSNAADEVLAARVTVAEKSLMDLALRVNRGLRSSIHQEPRKLLSMVTRIPAEVFEEFAAHPEAIDYMEGMREIWRRVGWLTPEEDQAFMSDPGEMTRKWRFGADESVMDGVAHAIYDATEALYQSRLGQWPAACVAANRKLKLAWSLAQLIDVVEPTLRALEQNVAEQEATVNQQTRPRMPLPVIKRGKKSPPHP